MATGRSDSEVNASSASGTPEYLIFVLSDSAVPDRIATGFEMFHQATPLTLSWVTEMAEATRSAWRATELAAPARLMVGHKRLYSPLAAHSPLARPVDYLSAAGDSSLPSSGAMGPGLAGPWHSYLPTSSDLPAGDDGWGPAVSDEEATELEQANIQLQVEQRREQLKVSFTRAQAADMLGVSAQTVSEWVAQHRLVGLKDGREWRFPAWQFTPDDAEPVLPDLRRLVDAFPGGVVSLSRWMNRPNDNFDGRTPAQEMVRDSDHVFAIVETLAAA
ncbi:helix-turn-helix domain-containing protein [Rhodococcus rhodnii]|uniref:helix-turn-helix domain-containing protein n=1 Tax=Rhodococcus rhodnii TaxID=38312 RepID=UPI000B115DB9|nr:helix-turn-helix domain-containing protein [Rhodococcus rhodnii]